jgi:leader peptidase (prepilin peptidase) / N-methyltransferase
VPDWLLPLILAPFIGSFAGVLIRRLPAEQPVALARSRCEACGHVLGPRELIPLVSIVLLRGHCRWCGARIAFTHLAVELACLVIAAWAVLAETDTQLVWLDCVLGWTLLTLAWIDWEHMLLPDALTLPLILAGLGATLLLDPAATTEHAAAAAAGYLAFRAIEITYRRLRGRDGLGQGDAKLMAAAGAWLGLAPLPTVTFMAAAFGLAIAAGLRIAGQAMHRGSAIPLGPALCAAIWVTWLGFDPILPLLDRLS